MVKLQAPIEVELKVSITDGMRNGVVTIGMPLGQYIDAGQLRARVEKFCTEEMPKGFRLMTKREWFNSQFGQAREEDEDGNMVAVNIAMPGGEDWQE